METQIRNKPSMSKTKKIVIVSLIVIIALLIVLVSTATFFIINSDKIYNGVYVNNVSVGGLTKAETTELLNSNFQEKYNSLKIVLLCKDATETLDAENLNLNIDAKGTVEKAYNVGRTGNIITRLLDIFAVRNNKNTIDLTVNYDEKQLESTVKSIYDKIFIAVKEPKLLIEPKQVSIVSGHYGEKFDKGILLKQLAADILDSTSGTIDIPVVITNPTKINVDSYYKKIYIKAKNATVGVVENKLVYSPEKDGRDIDKVLLSSIISEVENKEDEIRILPVVYVNPLVTEKDISSTLFKDTLYSYSTYFNSWGQNNRNRTNNIKLAVAKINGTYLGVNQVFSLNTIVGERTVEAGYEEAYIYTGNTVVPGTGGGICQVSTTLYNAVLYSDLTVVERRNHRFTVSYVPYGTDATVAYGSTDFKFKNSTKWPLQVRCWVTNNSKLTFSIIGTNDTPQKKVELRTVTLSTTDFSRSYTNDSSLKKGSYIITHSGYDGYIVDTYKIIKMNGKIISNQKITHNIYQPLNEQVLRGTKVSNTSIKPSVYTKPKATATPKPNPTVTKKPNPTFQPTLAPTA